MQFDFATALVVAALLTGVVWALDALFLAERRARAAASSGDGAGEAVAKPAMPWYVDYSRSFFPVIIAVLVLRSFIVEPFRIPSGSMMPTLLAGDFILVNKFAFGMRLPVTNTKIVDSGAPSRGDIAVFRYPEDPAVAFIKRIVALPGDRVVYRDKQLWINDQMIEQQPLPEDADGALEGYDLLSEALGAEPHQVLVRKGGAERSWSYRVPEGHYFVLGDNRDNSRDSRYWGPLPEGNLIGKAFMIWMNLDCVTGNGNCNRIGRGIE